MALGNGEVRIENDHGVARVTLRGQRPPAQRARYLPPATRWSARRLDLLLELLERRSMTATDLRVLLAVIDRERSLRELVDLVTRPAASVRKTAGRLCLAGMLRQTHDPHTDGPAYAITPRGLAALKPLLTAAGGRRT
jgi:hypothetical protein